MSYRAAEIKPLCVQCGGFAEERCWRCGRPLCWRHHSRLPDRRCNHCEAEFRHRPQWVLLAELAAVGLVVIGLILGAAWLTADVAADRSGHPIVMIVPAIIAVVPVGWFRIATAARRRRFLRERRGANSDV